MRGLCARRPVRVLLLLLLLAAAWQGWLAYQAGQKIPPDLERYASPRGTVDLLVELPFAPERFHILTFQRFGRVSGTRENAVEVRSVPLRWVREIARFYWVRRITPLQEDVPLR